MIETILTRSDFVLTLSLDDESGAFECECTPPNQAERQEVRKITRSWVSHIGRGRAQRLTGCVAKVKVIDPGLAADATALNRMKSMTFCGKALPYLKAFVEGGCPAVPCGEA